MRPAWEETYNLRKAFELARWLIEEQGVDRKKAYIIGARKYKLENWHDVQKEYNEWLRERQPKLI